MEMQYWDATYAIVYCPLYVWQSIRFIPVKVSKMLVFGFKLKKRKKKAKRKKQSKW